MTRLGWLGMALLWAAAAVLCAALVVGLALSAYSIFLLGHSDRTSTVGLALCVIVPMLAMVGVALLVRATKH